MVFFSHEESCSTGEDEIIELGGEYCFHEGDAEETYPILPEDATLDTVLSGLHGRWCRTLVHP